MNAVIYARYSSHAQREESIEGQLRECQAYARRENISIVGEYIDRAVSGRTDEREGFQRMIRDAEGRRFEAVIVYALDRFARNRYDSAIYKARLKKCGVRVLYAKTSIPDSPEGIILESVMEGYAEYYSENLKVHVRRGMHENALEAKSNGGNIPLGFRIVDHRYVIEPVGAAIVKDIFNRYASGEAPSKIVDSLNARGCRTSTGRPFSRTSLKRMLSNKKYIGTYVFDEVEIPGAIPRIVDDETFDKVQEMKESRVLRPRRRKVEYMLSGRLVCGKCGKPMAGESGTGKGGKTYNYYKCLDRKRGGGCTKAQENKEALELTVARAAMDLLDDDTIAQIARRSVEILKAEYESNSAIAALTEQIADTSKRIENLLRLTESGEYLPSVTKRIAELESLKQDYELQLAHEATAFPTLTEEQITYWLSRYRDGDINDPDFRRSIIEALVQRVYAYDEDDGSRRYVVAFNLSKNNTRTLTLAEATVLSECSDKPTLGEPLASHPNTYMLGSMIVTVIR